MKGVAIIAYTNYRRKFCNTKSFNIDTVEIPIHKPLASYTADVCKSHMHAHKLSVTLHLMKQPNIVT